MVISEVGCVAGWSAAYTKNSGPMDASLKVQLISHRKLIATMQVRYIMANLSASII
jgi:hypothetical protein